MLFYLLLSIKINCIILEVNFALEFFFCIIACAICTVLYVIFLLNPFNNKTIIHGIRHDITHEMLLLFYFVKFLYFNLGFESSMKISLNMTSIPRISFRSIKKIQYTRTYKDIQVQIKSFHSYKFFHTSNKFTHARLQTSQVALSHK